MASASDFISGSIKAGDFWRENVVDLAVYYGIGAATYDTNSFAVTTQETSPYGVTFSTDGTKMYVSGSNATLFQYTLSTAWDLSTASYASKSLNGTTQDGQMYQWRFSSDGSKVFGVGNINNIIYQYTLSTPWDVSTGSYASKSFSVNSQDTNPLGIDFKSDGTAFYISGDTNNTVYQYTLSTAWDISTASYASKSFSVATQLTTLRGITFSADGKRFQILAGNPSNTIYQYNLSTAWDISTASYSSKSFSVNGQDTDGYDICFGNSGQKLYYIGNSSNSVYRYTALSSDGEVDVQVLNLAQKALLSTVGIISTSKSSLTTSVNVDFKSIVDGGTVRTSNIYDSASGSSRTLKTPIFCSILQRCQNTLTMTATNAAGVSAIVKYNLL